MKFEKIIDGQEYVYEEEFWSGKKKLKLKGQTLIKTDKKYVYLDNGEKREEYKLKGNMFFGVKLIGSDKKAIHIHKNSILEWILLLFPLLGIIGCVFSGVVNAFLGVFCCLAASVINMFTLRSKKHKALKIVICLMTGIILNFLWFFVFYMTKP